MFKSSVICYYYGFKCGIEVYGAQTTIPVRIKYDRKLGGEAEKNIDPLGEKEAKTSTVPKQLSFAEPEGENKRLGMHEP